jgi:hypothetical protein
MTGCTVPAFRHCSGTCFTISATRGFLRTMSSGVDAARSTWISQLTLPTQASRSGSPRPPAMISMTPWRGLPTSPSRSSVSATYRALPVLPLPCSLSRTRATRCGVSAWPLWVTQAFGISHGMSVHGTLRPAHELHVPGGHGDWCLPVATAGGV